MTSTHCVEWKLDDAHDQHKLWQNNASHFTTQSPLTESHTLLRSPEAIAVQLLVCADQNHFVKLIEHSSQTKPHNDVYT